MKYLLNTFWYILTGFIVALINVILGVVLCVTIVFIPLGIQLLKLANVFVLPFGVNFQTNFKQHPVANVLYDILIGWLNALLFLVLGSVWCVTLIGIPFGIKCYKLSIISLSPVGLTIA